MSRPFDASCLRATHTAATVVMLISLAAACGPAPAPTPSATEGDAPANPFLEAARLASADIARVAVTDWQVIRQDEGLSPPVGTPSEEDRVALIGVRTDRHAPASLFAGDRTLSHREAWGWDQADLEWEAKLGQDTTLAHAVRFRADYPLADLRDLFAERGYAENRVGSATVFTAERDLFIDWQSDSSPAMLNVALFEDDRLLLLAEDPEVLRDLLRVGEGERLIDDDANVETFQALAGVSSGVVLTESPCTRASGAFDHPAFVPPPDIAELLSELSDYRTLGMGYLYPAGETEAHFTAALTFESADAAAADVEARSQLAEVGFSFTSFLNYTDLFSVRDARAVDRTLVMELTAAGQPRLLMTLVDAGDLLFAACPG